MKRIRFDGARRKGTLKPRRLWVPGEVISLEDSVAEELVKDPEFPAGEVQEEEEGRGRLGPGKGEI